MKFRQHIRVYGYPEALKVKKSMKHPGRLYLNGVGEINLMSKEKTIKFRKLMDENGIKYKDVPAKEISFIKYLCTAGQGIHKGVRGRKYKGDILYTVEANDERELLDKRDKAIEELKILRVPYEDVCRWVCESAPKTPAKKMFKQTAQKIPEDISKLKNKVEDLQDTIDRIEKKNIKKTIDQERQAREGVLT